MEKKQIAVATLFAAVLLTTIIVPMSTQQGTGTYDPWLDYNEDGKIDVSDLHPLGGSYGTMGDPTKNVNVTNWPQSYKPLFTEYLYLRAQECIGSRSLIDENMQYVPYLEQSESTNFYLEPSIWLQVFDASFTYEKMPVGTYRILGRPTVSLTFNFTTSDSALVVLQYNVTLWKKLPDSSTELLCTFDKPSETLSSGILGDHQVGKSFSTLDWVNVAIRENERLMLHVELYALNLGPTAILFISELIFRKNTDDFRLDIPIVTNP